MNNSIVLICRSKFEGLNNKFLDYIQFERNTTLHHRGALTNFQGSAKTRKIDLLSVVSPSYSYVSWNQICLQQTNSHIAFIINLGLERSRMELSLNNNSWWEFNFSLKAYHLQVHCLGTGNFSSWLKAEVLFQLPYLHVIDIIFAVCCYKYGHFQFF